MSFQARPQQLVQGYPNSVTNQPPSNHSNGSFGTVFIVLAVIVVISAIACFLGRLCNRRYQNNHQSHSHHQKASRHQKKNHNFRSKERDIEIGFDKRIPSSPTPNGHGGGGGRGPNLPANGVDMMGFEMKLGDGDGEMREGA